MSIITDTEAIHYILKWLSDQDPIRYPRFACYLGAGASAEAGVKTAAQICEEIRHDQVSLVLPGPNEKARLEALEKALNWDNKTLQYMSCLRVAYPDPSLRVEYFRNLIRGIVPSFAHHALALLITYRYLKSSCLTTNFDKLLENAFVLQGDADCQPIRTEDELRFWVNTQDRQYVLKLHGDYDTDNILNTRAETVNISKRFQDKTGELLAGAGLVVLGAAGYEKSVHTMFDTLSANDPQILRFGLLWGVYMGRWRPKGLDRADVIDLVTKQLDRGIVSDDIRRMIEDTQAQGRFFNFFPIWTAANFMYDLINATKNRELIGIAQQYLDREMRLRNVFSRAGLSKRAIDKHLSTLELKRTHLRSTAGERQVPEEAIRTSSRSGRTEVRILYGDITSRTFMCSKEFSSLCRAVVSPDDTFISAGGGVAEGLLVKAGQQFMLNELSKVALPVREGTVTVTSGGNLPVHYLIHAAAIKVEKNGVYSVSKRSVCSAMMDALGKASVLGVEVLWVPLMGSGVAGLQPREALEGILEAIRLWESKSAARMIIMICIYKLSLLEKSVVKECIKQTLASRFILSHESARESSH